MRHDQATEEMIEKAALYALGSLSQHEAKAFEVHLAEGCKACRAELAQFEEVAGLIGAAAAEADPPARLRGMLLDAIQKEPVAVQAAPFRIEPRQEFRAESHTKKRSGFSSVLPWAVAASVAILAVVSLMQWRTANHQIAAIQQAIQTSEQRARQLQIQLTETRQGLHEANTILVAVESPGAERIALDPQESAPSSDKGTVYWDKQDRQWVVSTNMAPVPSGKVYQLWFVGQGAPRSAGLIKTDASGHGFLVTDVPGDFTAGAAAITLEPDGGSPGPTTKILVLGKSS